MTNARADYEVTARDMAAAQRLHFSKSVLTWRSALALLVLATFLGSIFGPLEEGLFGRWSLILGLFFAVSLFGLIWLILWLLLPFQARQIWNQTAKMRQHVTVTWDDMQVHFESTSGHSTYQWSQFYRWAKSRTVILLYVNGQLFFVLPLRAFHDGSESSITRNLRSAGVKER